MKQLKNYKMSVGDENMTPEDELRHAKEKYGNMDENALISELKRQVSEQKKAGNYSPEQMLEITQYLSPYLSDEQKKQIESIIGSNDNE